jgi:hypothetical protein
MKKYFVLLIIFTIFIGISKIEADSELENSGNFENGNGTIIEIKYVENIVWVLRKHIQRIEFPVWFDDFSELLVYEEPVIENPVVIATLKKENFNILQVLEARTDKIIYYWIKIQTDSNIIGWIFCEGHEYRFADFRIPYFDNRWEILEKIVIGGRTWTVRKMNEDDIVVFGDVNIYDYPGLTNTNILSHINRVRHEIFLNVLAVTEEKEIITKEGDFEFSTSRNTNRWVKINYNGIVGWIFGGHVSVNRGGPYFWTPEDIIDWRIAILINGI